MCGYFDVIADEEPPESVGELLHGSGELAVLMLSVVTPGVPVQHGQRRYVTERWLQSPLSEQDERYCDFCSYREEPGQAMVVREYGRDRFVAGLRLPIVSGADGENAYCSECYPEDVGVEEIDLPDIEKQAIYE